MSADNICNRCKLLKKIQSSGQLTLFQDSFERKSMLYQTGVEYWDYTLNHVPSCSHGCKYPCYAFLLKKCFGQVKTYEDWLRPSLVSNTLELFNKEIPRLKTRFSPFCNDRSKTDELCTIRQLNIDYIKCCILTKRILPI